MKEKRLVGYFVLLVFSLILFIVLSNSASAAITVVSPKTNYNYSITAVFNVSYTNGTEYTDAKNATFYYNVSGVWTYFGFTTDCNNGITGASSSCNATLTIPPTLEGRYSINATLGNNTAYGASVITTNVMLDSKAPNVSFDGQTNAVNNGDYSGTVTLNVSVTDGGAGVDSVYFMITDPTPTLINVTKASTSGGGYYNISFPTSGLIEGVYSINVLANDTLNNLNNSGLIQITIDNTAPTGAFSCSPSSVNAGQTITCTCSPTDTLSGVDTSVTSYIVNPDTTSVGIISAVCRFYDLAGNTGSATTTYTVNSIDVGVTTSKTTIEKINSWTKISPGAAAIMKDFDSRIGIKDIQINVNNEAQSVRVTVIKYDGQPAEVSVAKSGAVYQYIQIDTQNLNERLEKAVVQFRVEKSWVADNNLQKEDVAVHKLDSSENVWNELTTTYKSEDNTYYYYDVEVDSFSYFAIGEKVQAKTGGEIIAETLTKNYLWVWIVISVVVLAGVIFFLFKFKKRK